MNPNGYKSIMLETPLVTSVHPSGSRFARSGGSTLIELLISLSIMTVLLGGLTSAVLIASHSLPTGNDPLTASVQAGQVVDQIARDLLYATTFSESTNNAVTFTVADRGHGTAGPETIRYAWSGTPGDPLTRQYNSGTVVTVCQSVEAFTLDFKKRVGTLVGMPHVLLIVNDDPPNAQDLARQNMIESWGFTVDVIQGGENDTVFAPLIATADVIYESKENGNTPPASVFNATLGYVTEKRNSISSLGISTSSNWTWLTSINILNNTHAITQSFATGPLAIFGSTDYAIYAWGTIAPDGQILAIGDGYNMLVAVGLDGELSNGKYAPARRVLLPWGDRTFDINNLTSNGQSLMKSAILWAAAPVYVSAVQIALQPDPDPASGVGVETLILNQSRPIGP